MLNAPAEIPDSFFSFRTIGRDFVDQDDIHGNTHYLFFSSPPPTGLVQLGESGAETSRRSV